MSQFVSFITSESLGKLKKNNDILTKIKEDPSHENRSKSDKTLRDFNEKLPDNIWLHRRRRRTEDTERNIEIPMAINDNLRGIIENPMKSYSITMALAQQ